MLLQYLIWCGYLNFTSVCYLKLMKKNYFFYLICWSCFNKVFRSISVKVFCRPHFIYLHFLNLILANNFWRNQIEKAYLFMQMLNDTFEAGIEKITIFILGLFGFWLEKLYYSGLHWLDLGFLFAVFVQWSILVI